MPTYLAKTGLIFQKPSKTFFICLKNRLIFDMVCLFLLNQRKQKKTLIIIERISGIFYNIYMNMIRNHGQLISRKIQTTFYGTFISLENRFLFLAMRPP